MLKDLEALALKQEQIAECALQLQNENHFLKEQIIAHLQQIANQGIEHAQLAQENHALKQQIQQIEKSLNILLTTLHWQQPSASNTSTLNQSNHNNHNASQLILPNPKAHDATQTYVIPAQAANSMEMPMAWGDLLASPNEQPHVTYTEPIIPNALNQS